jgi:ferritin-like metal-binding protein YciE
MQKTLKMASSPVLREGIQLHIDQTQTQIERVEQAMEKLAIRPGRKVCEAMRGLVEEAQHEIGEQDSKGPILDLVIVAGMQRIEHYEIAAYGTDIALAKAFRRAGDRRSSHGNPERGEGDRPQTDGSHTATYHTGGIGTGERGEQRSH